ncbi:MAG: glycosyl transferase [Flavobacterium sp.]|nr:glycosyl transferase [Flavobacterium sp.]
MNLKIKKLSIIIPVYNEFLTLEKIINLINKTKLLVEKEIIIVDDYSTDGSRQLVENLRDKYKIVLHNKNLGKGAAIKSGLEFASGDYVIIQDADLEYNPNDYNKLLDVVSKTGDKVVFGSRNLMANQRSNNVYYYGGKFITAFANLLFGSKLTDINTCYKMFKTDLLMSLDIEQKRFSFCEEVTAKLLERGIKIKEVPINYYPRKFNEGKKIRYHDGIKAIFTLLKYKFFQS